MIYIILYCSAAITAALPSSVPTKFDITKWDVDNDSTVLKIQNNKTKDSYFFPKSQCVVHIGKDRN